MSKKWQNITANKKKTENILYLKGLEEPAKVKLNDNWRSEYEGIPQEYIGERLAINNKLFLKIQKPDEKTQFYKIDTEDTEKWLTGDTNLCVEATLTNSMNPDDSFKSLRIINGDGFGGKFNHVFGGNAGLAYAYYYDNARLGRVEWNILYAKHNGEYITAQASRNKNIYEAFFDEVKEKGVKISELPEKLRDTLMAELPWQEFKTLKRGLTRRKMEKLTQTKPLSKKLRLMKKAARIVRRQHWIK